MKKGISHMKVNVWLETGFAGVDYDEDFEMDDGATEEEIEAAAKEAAFDRIDWGYKVTDRPKDHKRVVLDFLKERYSSLHSVIGVLYQLHEENMTTNPNSVEAWKSYRELNSEQEAEVIREFGTWVLVNGTAEHK